MQAVLGKRTCELLRATYNLEYIPNLKNPKSFNEKIIAFKLNSNWREIAKLVDKLQVREFVESRVGSEYLNEVYFSTAQPSQIPWEQLPEKFIIKTNHSGGGQDHIIVKSKDKINIKKTVQKLEQKLDHTFGTLTNEGWYALIEPMVFVEELMLEYNNEVPADYKLFCFHGKCKLIQIDNARFTDHTRSFYSPDWQYQDFGLLFSKGNQLPRPDNLEEMVRIAEALSQGFDFVRVDLYSYKNSVRFGELTFAPGAGWEAFSPKEIDYKIGKLM